MLYILQELVDLDSPFAASSSANGSSKGSQILRKSSSSSSGAEGITTTKGHILTLFPLITKTIRVAQGDEEMLTLLCRALQEVQSAFE